MSCRITPVAQVTSGMTALNVPGQWITGALTMANARTACLAAGSVSVTRGFMGRHVKPVNLGDTAKTASQVMLLFL